MRALYLLRGAPGSGKSTWVEENEFGPLAISPDAVRLAMAGIEFDAEGKPSISQRMNDAIWSRVKELVETRMKEGLTTIIDSTMVDTRDISMFRNLAESYRYRVYIVDFTDVALDTCRERNRMRPFYKQVPEYVIERMHAKSKRGKVPTSIPVLTPEEAKRQLDAPIPLSVNEYAAVNFIGDIHGCHTALMSLLKEMGGTEENNYINDDELYVFLGDYLDRGLENDKVLEFLMRIAARKNVRLLEGNHERHLSSWSKKQKVDNRNFADTRRQLEEANIDLKDVRKFVRHLGQFFYCEYGGKRIFACHGGISGISRPFAYVSTTDLVNGFGAYKEVDEVEESWEEFSRTNGEILVHGHRAELDESIHPYDRVYCLEGGVEHGGSLRCVRFETERVATFEVENTVFAIMPELVDLDKCKDEDMGRVVAALRENDFVIEKTYEGISSFNFSNKAFFKGAWDSQTIRARGLFIDTDANKVRARSYDKFFNLGERAETSLSELRRSLQFPVNIYLKENGYLGICASDGQGALFTASKSTPFGDHAKRFAHRLKSILGNNLPDFAKYLESEGLSAVFEVIEPDDDPHIVEYLEPRLVLLALVRNSIHFKQLPYKEMRDVANRFRLEPKQLLGVARNFNEFCKWASDLEDENWTLDGKHVEGIVAEDSKGFMVKVKCQWYRKWKLARGILKDIARRGRSSKVETLVKHYGDAESIYKAALLYGKTHPRRGNARKGLSAPSKGENVIAFRRWYENEFLHRSS